MRKLRTIEMNRLTVEEFRRAQKLPLVVVLDDVRSLHNVGSVFRTCDAFRVSAICLCGITATPPSAEIHKTALGAEDSVSWTYYATAQEAVSKLHEQGYLVYSVEQAEGSTPLHLFAPHRSTSQPQLSEDALPASESAGMAIVLGNEVKGVHQEVVDMCDGCLEIPQFGTKHSLNVSVAAGIVVWEFARQMLLCPPEQTTQPEIT